jgi:inner membrane protein
LLTNYITTPSENAPALFDRFSQWLKESVTVKLAAIGFLVLILLIPTVWVLNLMEERQQRAESVMDEVASRWSGSQTLSGPILVVPYREVTRQADPSKTIEIIRLAFFLPDVLTISGTVLPQTLHRGIFDVVVYQSDLTLKDSFLRPDVRALGLAEEQMLWTKAYLISNISDLRGIHQHPPVLTNGSRHLLPEPVQDVGLRPMMLQPAYPSEAEVTQGRSATGIMALLNWQGPEDFIPDVEMKIYLKGSHFLYFIPSGKTTKVTLSGPWSDPSFDGAFLPDEREVTAGAFSASWNILHFNRPIPQQWKGNDAILRGSEFGLKLLVPVDAYQKSIRTAKYGILIILLTFVALLLVEITQQVRIHPFQYILIGAALVIFYTLLLSLSEQVGYTIAYWVSAIATVTLITAYSSSFFSHRRLMILLGTLLMVFYSFIFVVTLLQDYALLIGSVGMFLTVGALMYVSRKIEWYRNG